MRLEKKAVFGIMLTLLLTNMFTFAFNIQPAKAGPRTWTVDDDRVQCPDADFTEIQDAVSVATAGDTILVYQGSYTENVVVNKDHLTITSTNGAAFTVVDVRDSGDHAFVVSMNNVTISGFTIKSSPHSGVVLSNAKHCNVSYNIFSQCSHGISLHDSSSNKIVHNSASQVATGISLLDASDDNTLTDNNLLNNNYGIFLYRFYSTRGPRGNILSQNIANLNLYYGIYLDNANGNTISENSFNSNKVHGVYLLSSSGNTITNNHVSNNNDGVCLTGPVPADSYSSSNNNILTCNTISNNTYYGIGLNAYSRNNTINKNTIVTNGRGIEFYNNASNNVIYLNNFIGNVQNAYCYPTLTNSWNTQERLTYTYNGKTYTNYLGNYWDDYTGNDVDKDGIGDAPHSIDGDKDNYPLVKPWENYFLPKYNITKSFCAPSGTQPNGLAWDGENLWMSSYMLNGGIYKLNPTDGSVLNRYTPPVAQYDGYGGLTYDGSYLWQADAYGGGIYKLNPSDCSVVSSIPSPDKYPSDLAWDGSFIWVCGYPSQKIYKISPTDGSIISEFNVPQGTGQAQTAGFSYDGAYLWLSGSSDIFKLNLFDCKVIGSFPAPCSRPDGLAWDGRYLWCASFDQGIIYQIDVGIPVPPVPDFSITASPTSLTIQQGSSGSSTITITSINGFNQPVQLTKSGAPSGVTATLNPQQVTPPAGGSKTCTLTVSVDATATPGSYPLTVTGTSGALSHNVRISLEITAAPPPEWTFAVITDLHIGRGYEEGTATFRHVSNYNDQDYYLTDRLQNVVKWIRDNAVAYNIKFVVITGDITEDGTQVEMHRANMTLAGLGNIPYFPVIGNHDLNNGGTSNFENEFNDAFFVAQCAKLDVTWENNRTNEVEAHLQNYAFRYKEKNFVFLDCVDRKAPWTAKLYASTLNVLTEFVDEGKPTILFSHHPMIQSYEAAFDKSEMDDLASAILGTKTLANFAGHIHGYFDQTKWFFDEHSFDSKRDAIQLWHGIEEYSSTPTFFNANGDYRDEGYETPGNIPVITTEAMMVGSNEPTPTEKGVIRLATVTGDTITSSEKGVFQSLNPHIICAVRSVPCLTGTYVYFQVYAFTKMFNTGRAIEYRLYIDGQLDDRIKYSSAIELKDFTAFLKYDTSHEVILTVTGYAPDGSQVVESIRRNVIVGKLSVILKCPVNIVVVDPIGRSISAESNEIPNATYVEADPDRDGNIEKFIEILAPIDGNYVIKLNGTDSGLYSMSAQFATSEDVLSFNATEIPVSLGAIHEFTIDWAALSQGDDGVTVNVDSNGDGTFEKIFIAGSELTRDEFMQHVFPVEAFPMWIAGVAFAAVAIVTITIAVFWRKRKQPSIKKPS